jgi:hypothetical protein
VVAGHINFFNSVSMKTFHFFLFKSSFQLYSIGQRLANFSVKSQSINTLVVDTDVLCLKLGSLSHNFEE